MFIPLNQLCQQFQLKISGILHIGAHECEEASFYKNMLRIPNDRIIWVDANIKKVAEMRGRGYAKDRRGVDIGYITYQHNVHKYM